MSPLSQTSHFSLILLLAVCCCLLIFIRFFTKRVLSLPVTWRTLRLARRDKDNISLISGGRDLPTDRLNLQSEFQFGSRGRRNCSGCLKRWLALTFQGSPAIGCFLTRLFKVWPPPRVFSSQKASRQVYTAVASKDRSVWLCASC